MKSSALLILLPFAQCSYRALSNSFCSLSIGTRFGPRTASAHQILSERDVPFEDIEPPKFQNGPPSFLKHTHSRGASCTGFHWDAENSAPKKALVEKIPTEPDSGLKSALGLAASVVSIGANHLLQSDYAKTLQDSVEAYTKATQESIDQYNDMVKKSQDKYKREAQEYADEYKRKAQEYEDERKRNARQYELEYKKAAQAFQLFPTFPPQNIPATRSPSTTRPPSTTRFPPIILKPLSPSGKKVVLGLDQTLLDENTRLKYFADRVICEFIQKWLYMDSRDAQLYMNKLIRVHGSVPKGLLMAKNIRLADHQEYLNRRLAYEENRYHRDLEALLKRVNADIVLLTDFSGEHAQKVLEDHGLLSYFHMIIAADPENSDCPVKPSPEAFRRVKEALRVSPKNIHYLDDNKVHMMAAHHCGWSKDKFPKYYQQRLGTTLFDAFETIEMSRLFRTVFPSPPAAHFRLRSNSGRSKLILSLSSIANTQGELRIARHAAECKFVHKHLGILKEDASCFIGKLRRTHGSLIKGLTAEYGVKLAVYEKFLIDNTDYNSITCNKDLEKLLKDVDADIFVIADLNEKYAKKVLKRWNVSSLVRGIFISRHDDPDLHEESLSEVFDQMEVDLGVDPSSIYYVCRGQFSVNMALNHNWNVARVITHRPDQDIQFSSSISRINNIMDLRGAFVSLFASQEERTVIE